MGKTTKGQPVVITTAKRGVFFGYTDDATGTTVQLANARNCIYWSSDIKGFIGLAATGPSAKCRIGPAADGTFHEVTSALKCTPEAVKAWEAAPWG